MLKLLNILVKQCILEKQLPLFLEFLSFPITKMIMKYFKARESLSKPLLPTLTKTGFGHSIWQLFGLQAIHETNPRSKPKRLPQMLPYFHSVQQDKSIAEVGSLKMTTCFGWLFPLFTVPRKFVGPLGEILFVGGESAYLGTGVLIEMKLLVVCLGSTLHPGFQWQKYRIYRDPLLQT